MIQISCDFVVKKNGSILLGKRKNCFGEGSWAFPGGRVEFNEKVLDCVKRELKEELGIVPISQRFLTYFDDISEVGGHHIHLAFIINKWEGEINLCEPEKCEEWKFFKRSALPENIFQSQKEIFKRLMII